MNLSNSERCSTNNLAVENDDEFCFVDVDAELYRAVDGHFCNVKICWQSDRCTDKN